jgi:DNA invertase Pin-like site-specific DNA recombinase
MRAVLYARVSTTDRQDPEVQLAGLREYASRRGWELCGTFVDRTSGSRESRPALDEVMSLCQQRKADVVIVWKLDRLGRSLKHLVNILAEWETLGIAFISLRDNLDLTTPSGKLMFHVIGAMAEFERALIQERVKAGLAQAKREGRRGGRPKRVWRPKTERRIKQLRAEGKSWQHISQETRIPVGTLHAKFR